LRASKYKGDTIVIAKSDSNSLYSRTKAYVDANFQTLDGTVLTSQLVTDTGLTAGFWEREIFVDALAAGVDISARILYVVPAGYQVVLSAASIVADGSSSGIDASNSSVWLLSNGANAIVTKTYDDDPAFPASGVDDDLGTLSETYCVLAETEQLKLTVTNGTTAATPPVVVKLVGECTKV
jgi:hypothetical protein